MTGSSRTACFRKRLPLVARNNIRSNAIDFSLGTRPVKYPSLTCLDESADISYKIDQQRFRKKCKWKNSCIRCQESEIKLVGKHFTWSSKGVSMDSSPALLDSLSLCWAVALLWAAWKNSPAWRNKWTKWVYSTETENLRNRNEDLKTKRNWNFVGGDIILGHQIHKIIWFHVRSEFFYSNDHSYLLENKFVLYKLIICPLQLLTICIHLNELRFQFSKFNLDIYQNQHQYSDTKSY